MSPQQAHRMLLHELRPLLDIKTKVMLTIPMDYILSPDGLSSSPRPSEQQTKLIAEIDALIEWRTKTMIENIERQLVSPASYLDPPAWNPHYVSRPWWF